MITYKKTFFAALFASFMLMIGNSKAYIVEITWPGPGTLLIDISFIIEGPAFDGVEVFERAHPDIVRDGFANRITVEGAGSYGSPSKTYFPIPAGWSAKFNFNDINIGKCFDLAELKAGVVDVNDNNKTIYPMQHLPIRKVEGGYYANLNNMMTGFADQVTETGKKVSEIDDPKGIAKIVGIATASAGGLLSTVGGLVSGSSCKNWNGLGSFTGDAKVVLLTTSFGDP
ncbi:MAG: hypothetical protein ACPGXY_05870 [Alphaproteobacteria bacterium]